MCGSCGHEASLESGRSRRTVLPATPCAAWASGWGRGAKGPLEKAPPPPALCSGPRVAHKAHCSSHSARQAAREGPALHGSVSQADPGDRGLDKQRGPGDAGSELTFPGHCEKCLQGRGPGLRTSPHSRAGRPLPTEGREVGLRLGDSGQVPGRRGWGVAVGLSWPRAVSHDHCGNWGSVMGK